MNRRGSLLWFHPSLLAALAVSAALYVATAVVGGVQGEYLRQPTVLAIALGALLARWRPGLGWLTAIIAMLGNATLLFWLAVRGLYPDGFRDDQPGGDLSRLADFQPAFALYLVAFLIAIGMATLLATRTTGRRSVALLGVALLLATSIVGAITLANGDWMTYDSVINTSHSGTDINLTSWPIVVLVATTALAWAIGVMRRVRRQAVAAHRADRIPAIRTALLSELMPAFAGAQRSGAAAERAWFATELHASVLPAIRSAVHNTDPSGTDQPGVRTRLTELEGELRRIADGKRSVVLDEFGLVEAIEGLVERAQQEHGIPIDLKVEGDVDLGRPPRRVEQAAFDICRLALDNAASHSRPTAILVTVATASSYVMLEVSNDGRGLDLGEVETARRAGRHGVPDMREAARAVSGHIVIEQAAAGTHVQFEWGRR
jgi:signal transduction histidine kinase